MTTLYHTPSESASESATHVRVVGDLGSPLVRLMVRGVQSIAMPRGWTVTTTNVDPRPTVMVEEVLRGDPDVLVLTSTSPAAIQHATFLSERVALVAADTDLTELGIPSVTLDDERIGQVAAEYLLSLDKAFQAASCYGIQKHQFAERRSLGFINAMAEAGVPVVGWDDPNAMLVSHGSAMVPAIDQWLERIRQPVALFACCDSWGSTFLSHCQFQRQRIPEDIVLVSTDNDELLCEVTQPAMSSIHVPREQLGIELGRLVVRVVAGETLPAQLVRVAPGQVIARRSSDVYSVADSDIEPLISYIHRNAHRPIFVDEVLNQSLIGHHRLLKKFRKALGRTIKGEICRARMEWVKRMLLTTDHSIEQIADTGEFSSASRLAGTFRDVVGLTPSAYRNQDRPTHNHPPIE